MTRAEHLAAAHAVATARADVDVEFVEWAAAVPAHLRPASVPHLAAVQDVLADAERHLATLTGGRS